MTKATQMSLAILIALVGTAGGASDLSPLEAELFEADRAFAKATADNGLEGWLSFFAEDAARVEMHGRIIRGHAGIRGYDGELLDDPAFSLAWDPTDAGTFGDGKVGFTRGRYELSKTTPEGTREILSTGSYLTIWQRRQVGWRVLLDTGVPDGEDAGD